AGRVYPVDGPWDGWSHAKGGRLVMAPRPRLRGEGGQLLGPGGACREKRDVHALEGFRARLLHANGLALERYRLAHRPLGGEDTERLHGELALVEKLERGLSHRARDTHHRYRLP